MYLNKINIENFRGLKSAEIALNKGITILLGENNAGKTTIIDAIRTALTNYSSSAFQRLSRHDFHNSDTTQEIRLAATFKALSPSDTCAMFDSLFFNEGTFDAKIGLIATYNNDKERCSQKNVAGQDLSNDAGNVFNYIDVTYLKPLRDPDNLLKPGRNSYISRGIQHNLKDDEEKQKLADLIKGLNEKIADNNNITDFSELINKQTSEILGKDWKQKMTIILDNDDFLSFIADLKLLVEEKEYYLNGLGLNNIIAIAMILAMHKKADGYRMLLIEEPEAHLHPILQRTLLEYIKKTVQNNNNIQVVISSHSPNLAAAADLSSISLIRNADEEGNFSATLIGEVFENNTDLKKEKRKLERFLDATRAEIFFNKRLILVEGIAEAILLPYIAKVSGFNLLENRISIINCMGLNFGMFIPILEATGIRSLIISDDDSTTKNVAEGGISHFAKQLINVNKTAKYVHVELVGGTFERALFQSNNMLSLAKSAALTLHPRSQYRIDQMKTGDELFEYLFGTKGANAEKHNPRTPKGEFAQALMNELEINYFLKEQHLRAPDNEAFSGAYTDLTASDFPEGIIRGLEFLIA